VPGRHRRGHFRTMADTQDKPTLDALKQAAARAEEAAAKAEKAAVRGRYWLIAGLSFGLVGAVLAFALEESGASVLGVSLRPLGGVLFAVGALLVAGAAIGSMGNGSAASSEGIKAVGGLIAVVVAITAVTALTIVTVTLLDTGDDSIVALTSSALGIISAIVGAYLGIKITADTSARATNEAKGAAIAGYAANVAKAERDGATEKAKELAPEKAGEIEAAGTEAGEHLAQRLVPTPGGGPR
jgi:hypothetical protein